MEQKTKSKSLTKLDSLALKGVAILFLLFHHLYCSSDRFSEFTISFTPFKTNMVVSFSEYLKICVSIFAFITGYGLYKSISKTKLSAKSTSKWVANRIIKTFSGFWLIYILSFIATQLIANYPIKKYFGDGITKGLLNVLLDFLGLSNMFHMPTINATWWYMGAVLVYIIMIPIVFQISKKIGYTSIIILIILFPRVTHIGYPGGTNVLLFVLPVIFGMIFAQYDLFTKIDNIKIFKNKNIDNVFQFIIFTAILIASVYVAIRIERKSFWEYHFAFQPMLVIIYLKKYFIRIPVIKNILYFLGKNSMNIFLTHTFIRGTIFKSFTYSFGNFALIFIVLLLVSIALSIVIDVFKKIIRFDKGVNFISKKICESI